MSVAKRMGSIATLCLFILQACGGDHAAEPVNRIPTTIAAPDQAAVVAVKANLPVGAPRVASLGLNDGIGSVSVGSNGTFALPVFSGGPQFAYLTTATNATVGLGFVSSTATIIDATSTAQVLIYFAAGFYDLTLPYRVGVLDEIKSAAGFDAVVTVVSAAIAGGGIDTPTNAPLVTAALTTFVTALYASPAASAAAKTAQRLGRRVKDVRVTPGDLQSGINVINDFPNGIHFQNKYRRLATAYVDEVSSTDAAGNVTPKAVTDVVAPVQIPATSGVGSVVSTAVDAARVLAGAAGDYNPVSTDSTPLALEDGFTKTTYNVTIVGMGLPGGFTTLTDEQTKRQRDLVLLQLLQNYIVPVVCSIIVPLNSSQIDTFFKYNSANGVVADLISAVAVAAPQLYDLTDQGKLVEAKDLMLNTIFQSNALQGYVLTLVQQLILEQAGHGAAAVATSYAQRLLLALNVANGVLASYDIGVLTTQVALSHHADRFVVDVTADKVTLTPQTATVLPTATQNFVASVPSASDSGQSVVYTWTNTAVNGHLIDGQDGHRDNFDSSMGTVTYVPLSNGAGDDTITVTAYLVNNSQRVLVGEKEATVTVQQNPWVGSWVGSTTSTCGSFSGPLTLVITSTGPGTLALDYGGGGYPLTIDPSNPDSAQYNGNEVVDTLSGPNLNTLTSVEPDACQSGTFYKQ